jgi:quercetin dioxygenase-like cupin family protein
MNAIFITADGAADTLWFGNTLVDIVVSSTTGADGICVIEQWLPFGDSPPLHVHRNEDEVFHVLSGTLRLAVNGKEQLAEPGRTMLAPKGVPHTYRVDSPEGAHVLTITHGDDFERMMRAASRPAARRELPPISAPTPDAIALLTRLCAENNIEIVGPPLP